METTITQMGLPWWLRWERICLQCRRPGFNSWVGKIPWRNAWQLTPVFLRGGESHGQRNLVGYRSWGRKESDTTEQLSIAHSLCLDASTDGKFSSSLWKFLHCLGDEDSHRLAINPFRLEFQTQPLISRMTLGDLFNLFVPQLSHLLTIIELLQGWNADKNLSLVLTHRNT